ncbi:MAG: phosphoglucosamine mutase [bacterium]
MEGLIFSVSGARGIVGKGLDPLVLTEIAAHFGAFVGPGTVVVGRDSRVSGEMAAAAVTAGLVGVGIDVVDLGLASTPTVEVAVREIGAAGGVQISASHNPADWNALKLLSSRGIFLTASEGAELRARIDAGRPRFHAWDALGNVRRRDDLNEIHLDRILASELVDSEAVRRLAPRVVVDCVAGVGGPIACRLLERLGAHATFVHAEPTGRFPRNPEPVPENLRELGDAVRAAKADIGFALDPDADRVAVVDETGRPIGEEVTLAVVIDSFLPVLGGDVVVNVSTTMAIDDVAARHGARVHRTPVGEVNVTERMLEIGAKIGGEGNGGVIVPAVNPGRDGLLGIALWLTALAREGAGTAALAARIPSTVMRKEKIEVGGLDVDLVLRELASAFPGYQVDRTDGLKLLSPDGWVHVRKSNTEPILRLLAEARTGDAVNELVVRAREVAVRAGAAS